MQVIIIIKNHSNLFYFLLEMVNGKPLFTGVSENDQLKKIFKIRGTPNEKNYPDLKSLSEWNVIYILIFFY